MSFSTIANEILSTKSAYITFRFIRDDSIIEKTYTVDFSNERLKEQIRLFNSFNPEIDYQTIREVNSSALDNTSNSSPLDDERLVSIDFSKESPPNPTQLNSATTELQLNLHEEITGGIKLNQLNPIEFDDDKSFWFESHREYESTFCSTDSPPHEVSPHFNIVGQPQLSENQFIESLLAEIGNLVSGDYDYKLSLRETHDSDNNFDSLSQPSTAQQNLLLERLIKDEDLPELLRLLPSIFTESPIDKYGNTLLHLAVLTKNTEIIDLIAQYVTNSSKQKNSDDLTPLEMALKSGNKGALKILLERTNIEDIHEILPAFNKTILLMITELNDQDLLRLILRQNGFTAEKERSYRDALFLASRNGFHEGIRILVQHGIPINSTNEQDKTALDLAIEKKDLKTCDTLIRWGASVSSRSESDCTTHYLSQLIHQELFPQNHSAVKIKTLYKVQEMKLFTIASLLLGRVVEFPLTECLIFEAINTGNFTRAIEIIKSNPDFNFNVRDSQQNTLLHLAILRCNTPFIHILVLKAPELLNVTNGEDYTPIELAIQNANHQAVPMLVAQNQTPHSNPQSDTGKQSRLEVAIRYERESVVRFLLENGADANIKCSGIYVTPLLLAVFRQNLNLVRILAEFGADFSCVNLEHQSVFDVSSQFQNAEIFNALIGFSCDVSKIYHSHLFRLKLGTSEFEIIKNASDRKLDNIVKIIIKRDPTYPTPELALFEQLKKQKPLSKIDFSNQIKINTDLTDDQGNTLLHYAVISENTVWISYILSLGADDHIKNNYEMNSPIELAIKSKKQKIIDLVIESITFKDLEDNESDEKEYLFELALNTNCLMLIQHLFECGVNRNMRFAGGRNTALMKSVENDQRKITQFLLEQKVKLELTNNFNETALMIALSKGNIAIADMLLLNGAEPYQSLSSDIYRLSKCESKYLFIKQCEQRGHLGIISFVLKRKPLLPIAEIAIIEAAKYKKSSNKITQLLNEEHLKLHIKNEDGQTALHIAALCGNTENIIALSRAQLDANMVENEDGYTPLQLAIERSDYQVVDTLLTHCSVNRIDAISTFRGWSCMSLCMQKGDIKTAQKLLSRGANINAGCSKYNIPIYVAISAEKISMVEWLCQHGVDLEQRGSTELLPHFAAKTNNFKLMKILIKAGLDITEEDSNGDNVYEFSKKQELNKIIWLLRTEIEIFNEEEAASDEGFEIIDDSGSEIKEDKL
ncbi:hypothetical protein SOPP22_00710 [Shewanella sp. OPT22]|nr:hypothetical protein SOPP22_00710 [Shewanella sp. OPT22]